MGARHVRGLGGLAGCWLCICASAAWAQDEPVETPPTEGEDAAESAEEPSQEATAEDGVEGKEENRFVHTSHLQLRVNPIGLSILSDTGYRVVLFDSESMLLKGTRIDFGITTRLSPAFVWGGPYVEATPVAFLKLRAEFTPLFYFGNFGFLFEFEDGDDDWSPDRLEQIQDDDLGESASGWRALLGATLQLKVGPVAALYENRYTWYSLDVTQPTYESFENVLIQPDDAIWSMSGTLGYIIGADPTDWFLLVGARYDRHQTREFDFTRQLLGGILLWDIPNDWWSWGSPRVATILQTYLEDPFPEVEGDIFFAFQLSLTF